MPNSKNITFDQLQSALTRVKNSLDKKANTSHGNHVPKTETANNARFLRNDNTWQTITPVNIGAADRSHSHGSYVNQNAFTNIKVGDTTVAADSPTDTLTLTAGANVTLTPDATNDTVTIAAKDTVYTHPTTSGYKHIPSGGSSGQILRWSADGTAAWGSDNNTDTKVTNTLNTTAKAYVTGTTSATTNTGTQVFDTGVYLDTTAGKLVATTFTGALSGNASSATKLQTARGLKIGNTSKNFDGSANVEWSLSEIGAAASNHGHSNMLTFKANHTSDWTGATSMADKVYMGGWHGTITDSSKNKGYVSLGLATSGKALDFMLDGDFYANENNLVLNTGNYKSHVTPANIGAANASHGTHVTYGGNGSATTVSRSDHTHNYAAPSHSHGLLHSNLTVTVPDTTTDNGWSMINSSYNGYILKSIRSNANAPAWLQGNYSAGIAFGGEDTKGVMSVAYNAPSIRFAGGNGTKPVWNMTLTGTSGKSYNMDSLAANTANTLATARTINGTSFNGSGNITTANWGTTRTITIGSTGKSVNGSGNVSWTLAEIGAAASNHSHSNYAASSHEHNYLNVKGTNTINSTANDTTAKWGAHKNSVHWYTETGKLNGQPSQWGYLVNIGQNSEVHQVWMTQSSGDLLHRGGNGDGWSGSWRTILDSSNYSTWAAAKSHSHNYAGSSSAGGNANAAVKLATPRSINGTNFDGSGNITTANWGTARTITIGGTGKSVNGSGNVSWSLSEIGALPTAGGTVSGNLAVSGAFSVGGKKITINSSAPSSPAVGDIWIKI